MASLLSPLAAQRKKKARRTPSKKEKNRVGDLSHSY
jgi:hypothetical protein